MCTLSVHGVALQPWERINIRVYWTIARDKQQTCPCLKIDWEGQKTGTKYTVSGQKCRKMRVLQELAQAPFPSPVSVAPRRATSQAHKDAERKYSTFHGQIPYCANHL